MKYKNTRSLLMLTALLAGWLILSQPHSALGNGWDVFYSADALPDEDPTHPWTLFETFDNDAGVATVSGGILKLDTNSEQRHWYYHYFWEPDNSVGWTFEVRVKTESDFNVSPMRDASVIYFSDEAKDFYIHFYKDRTTFIVRDGPVDQQYVDNTQFRTYRLCLKGADLKVYVDGFLFYTAEVTRNSTPEDYIEFGDFHDYYGAISHWDYVAWKYEYDPPPPVPTLTQWGVIILSGLLILSLIFMLRRRRAKVLSQA